MDVRAVEPCAKHVKFRENDVAEVRFEFAAAISHLLSVFFFLLFAAFVGAPL